MSETITPYTAQTITPYTAQTITPYTAQTVTPYTAQTITPYTAQTITPYTAQTITPTVTKPDVDLYPGRFAFGSIDSVEDSDSYTLHVTPGSTYLIYVSGAATGGGTLANPRVSVSVYGTSASFAGDDDSGVGLDAALVFTPAYDTQYTVRVTDSAWPLSSAATGSYTIYAVLHSEGYLSGSSYAAPTQGAVSAARTPSSGNDDLRFSEGNDSVSALEGDDAVSSGSGNDTVNGNSGNDTINGNSGDDSVRGGRGNDVLHGGQGIDLVCGDVGNDEVFGDLGGDTIFGGQGNDVLHGGQNDDTVSGDRGNDILWGDRGNDVLWGGDGTDVFVFGANSGLDVIGDFSIADGDRIGIAAGMNCSVMASSSGDAIIVFSDSDAVGLVGVRYDLVTASLFVTT